jgi:hypothetical protein
VEGIMALCRLGSKKKAIIEKITGWRVAGAYVRGGWEHYWAQVWFVGIDSIPFSMSIPYVNYKTGEISWGNFDQSVLQDKGVRA